MTEDKKTLEEFEKACYNLIEKIKEKFNSIRDEKRFPIGIWIDNKLIWEIERDEKKELQIIYKK